MAASAKHFSLLFFLALFSSLHAHARDGHFFSKVTTPTTTTTPATGNPKETVEVPNKEQPLSKQEQDPNFIPDTQNGYGLYGQESDQLPPTTPTNPPSTTSNLPYKTESEQPYYYYDKQAYVTNPQGMSDTRSMDRGYNNNNNNNNNKQAYVTNPQGMSDTRSMDRGYNNNNNNNKQAYVTNPQGMSDTRFMDRGYTTTTTNYYNNNNKQAYVTNPQGMSDTRFMDRGYNNNNNNNKNNNYYMNKGYTAAATATDNYYNSVNNYNPQHQGMSDTRFLENGRYFYDIQSENNYNNGYGSSRGVDNYNRGYYGNSYNENSYVENNSMEGYQNQEQFQEDQEEFMP